MNLEENPSAIVGVEEDMANLNVEEKKICALCSEPAERRCSACKLVHYCSPTCQKEDWSRHRAETCLPCKVKSKGGDYGEEYYVASRDIPRGKILFVEPTLLPLPKMKQGTFKKNFSLMCVVCAKPLSTVRKCSVCKWPVCCKEHEESPIHIEYECRFLASNKLHYDKLETKQDLRILRLVRTYAIKVKHPDTWSKIKQLISPPFYYEDDFEIGNANMKDVGNLHEEMDLVPFISHDKEFIKDYEKILHLCRRRGFFNFSKLTEQEKRILGDRAKIGVFLYEKASRYLPHSCGPNLDWIIGEYPDFSIQIRASRSIKKGEMLTVSHLSQHLEQHQGAHVRRQHLRHLTNYLCPCKRCCDPTEYGSFVSAMACTTCQNQLKVERNLKNPNQASRGVTSTLESKLSADPEDLGFLLPKDPMDWGALDGIWECNRCGRNVSLSFFLGKMNDIVDEMNTYVNGRPGAELGLKSIITSNSGNFFHPNHWVIVSAVRNLLPVLRPDQNGSNHLQHYQNLYILSKYLIRVDAAITQNGLSSQRAYFQYVAAESRLNLTHANFEKSTPQKPMKEQVFIKSKEEIEEAMDYIHDIFLMENNVVNIAPQNRTVKLSDLMRTSRNGNELVRQFNSVIPIPDKAHRG